MKESLITKPHKNKNWKTTDKQSHICIDPIINQSPSTRIMCLTTSTPSLSIEAPSRAALRTARRVCIKAGTSIVANEDGRPSLTRLGAIVEQIAELNRRGVEVIFVSSGAVGMGERTLRKQGKLNMTLTELTQQHHFGSSPHRYSGIEPHITSHASSTASLLSMNNEEIHSMEDIKSHYDSACAAAGQFDMMNLYSSLFAQADASASQILVTQADFSNEKSARNLNYAVERLLGLGIVPIINENDAVSGGFTEDNFFSDNDSLAALCARNFGAEVLLLLTDVDGVYDSSPKENPDAKLLSFYRDEVEISIGTKSSQGRGGMASKIQAAKSAVAPGSKCTACVVIGGSDLNSIRGVLGAHSTRGQKKGTLFVTPGSDLEKQAIIDFKNEEVIANKSFLKPRHHGV
jgi:delta-1-pyrroline-5-carboxylate synthetase